MLKISMSKSTAATKTPGALTGSNKNVRVNDAAAELALKVHVLASNPRILSEIAKGDRMMREITDMVDLTEAPEDAVCSLVIDLLRYCDREKIDWTQDIMLRARERFRGEHEYEFRKR